jgi:DNA-binding response OmpR family regulator
MRTRRSLIVIDDEPTVLAMTARTLREAGYDVIAHASAREALADPAMATVDLVVADWTNRPVGGLELWQALQARPCAPRVIFVTAWAEEVEERLGPPPVGPAACLGKPFVARRLLATVERCLGEARGTSGP